MRGILWSLVIGILLSGGVSMPAAAALVTYKFAGTINGVPPDLAGKFSTGQSFSGFYSFDPATAPRAGGNGHQQIFDALASFSFTLGGVNAASNSASELQIDHQPGVMSDRYFLVTRAHQGLTATGLSSGFSLNLFSLRLDRNAGSLFKTASTLPVDVSLADFDSDAIYIFLDAPAGGLDIIGGTLTSFGPANAVVPAPASLALFGVALAAIGLVRGRLRKGA